MFLIWRLHGSLPSHRNFPATTTSGRAFLGLDRLLDCSATGPFTAREGNRILGLTGPPFWQDESYDRLVRDSREFARIARYIEMNPVQAGLAAQPEQFLWSSARPITNRPQVSNLPHSGPGWAGETAAPPKPVSSTYQI
jgi:hypothetical protein